MQMIKFLNSAMDRPKISQGVHIATLIQIIDAGVQPGYTYQGKTIPPSPKLFLVFEFPNVRDQDGKPISHVFNIFFSEYVGSKLNAYANALLGGTDEVAKILEKELNFIDLLGKSAQLQIGKTETEKANPKIITMMPLPAGLPHPKPSVTPTFFDMDNPDMALFETFLPWVQKKILEAENVPQLLKNFGSTGSKVPAVANVIESTAENF
jgi:hypothetical protein